jgi:hypothetical protein
LVVSHWITERIPYPFNNDHDLYIQWKHTLSDLLHIDPSSIIITGSGAFGVSLNPYKNYKLFDINSDIDIAVISDYFFDVSWRYLRNMGSDIHRLPPAAKQSVNDHVNKYIYWGTITTDRILNYLPFGSEWSKSLEKMSNIKPTKDRVLNARIYKDFDSFRAYQVYNLKSLRTQELERGIENV